MARKEEPLNQSTAQRLDTVKRATQGNVAHGLYVGMVWDFELCELEHARAAAARLLPLPGRCLAGYHLEHADQLARHRCPMEQEAQATAC